MHYPCRWRNNQTNKTFTVTKTGMATIRIEAQQQGGGDHGHAEYATNGADFLFDHVESHPEVGSGLGSLLFYLACHEAALAGCTNVKVSAGAWTAEEFYFKMGCHRDPAVMANPVLTAGLNAAQLAQLAHSAPIIGDVAHCHTTSGTVTFQRWELLVT